MPTFIDSAVPSTEFTTPARPLTFLITGCSSGIGLSLCRAVQEAGHKLIATSRNPSRTPGLVAEVEGKGGKWIALDVDNRDSANVIDDLEKNQATQIDVLINNAGWSIHQAAEQITEGEVRDQFETVFFGPYRLVRAAVPYMRRRRFGVVVNVGSGAGLEGRESMGAYAAAKAALDGISKVLYKEVAEFNVRVMMVHLGTFRTNMGNTARTGKVPIDDDYKGKVVHQMVSFLESGKFVGDGHPDKAARAIVEVVTGTGVGEGHEAEMFLPLGRDVVPRARLVRDRLDHALDVFEDVAMSVACDPSEKLIF